MEDFPELPVKYYQDVRKEIRSGDLLLCSGRSVFSQLIQKATRSVWSHVGFILRLDAIDRIMVLESVESIGVRSIPLSNYLRDYNGTGKSYPGRILLARHAQVKQENIAKLSRSAVDLFGYPYNTEAIVRIAAKISLHALGLSLEKPSPHTAEREFICSEYAHACFQSVGVTVAYNSMGFITPADFANCHHVTPICYMENAVAQTTVSA